MTHQLSLILISANHLPEERRRYQIKVKTTKNRYFTNYQRYEETGQPIIWNANLRLILTSPRHDLIRFSLREETWFCPRKIGEVSLSSTDLFYNEERKVNLKFVSPKSGLVVGTLTLQVKALNFGWSTMTSKESEKTGLSYIEPFRTPDLESSYLCRRMSGQLI